MPDEKLEQSIAPNDQPLGPTDSEDDTEGHSMLAYEQARSHARDRAREAQDWERKEALRKQAHGRKPERR
jgi:hypothetical protein